MAGIFQVPLRMLGSVSLGQYIRSIAMKSPSGAGSPLARFSVMSMALALIILALPIRALALTPVDATTIAEDAYISG